MSVFRQVVRSAAAAATIVDGWSSVTSAITMLALITKLIALSVFSYQYCHAFSGPVTFRSCFVSTFCRATNDRPLFSALVEALAEEGVLDINNESQGEEGTASSSPISATKRFGINSRGAKMNEVGSVDDDIQVIVIHVEYVFVSFTISPSPRLILHWLRPILVFPDVTKLVKRTMDQTKGPQLYLLNNNPFKVSRCHARSTRHPIEHCGGYCYHGRGLAQRP
jgi:hypothetical protein